MRLVALFIVTAALLSGCVGEDVREQQAQQQAQQEATRRATDNALQAVRFQAKMLCNSYGYADTDPNFPACQQSMVEKIAWDRLQAMRNPVMVVPVQRGYGLQ